MAEQNIRTEEQRIKDAFDAALNYLSVSARSEKEVRERLYKKGFHKNEVEAAIKKAKEYKFIDDENYVKLYYESYGKKYGVKKIVFNLTTQKGVDKNLVENVLYEIAPNDGEQAKALAFAEKYIVQKKITNRKDGQKVGAFLFRKGFEWNVINSVMSTLFDDVYEE